MAPIARTSNTCSETGGFGPDARCNRGASRSKSGRPRDHLGVEDNAGEPQAPHHGDKLGECRRAVVPGPVPEQHLRSARVGEEPVAVELQLVPPALADQRRLARDGAHRLEVSTVHPAANASHAEGELLE
jgi:hypothetical protein